MSWMRSVQNCHLAGVSEMENDGLEEKTVLCLTSSTEAAHNDCSTVIARSDCEVHTKENHANGWNEG